MQKHPIFIQPHSKHKKNKKEFKKLAQNSWHKNLKMAKFVKDKIKGSK